MMDVQSQDEKDEDLGAGFHEKEPCVRKTSHIHSSASRHHPRQLEIGEGRFGVGNCTSGLFLMG